MIQVYLREGLVTKLASCPGCNSTFAQNKEEAQWELDQCVPLKIKEGQIDKDTKQLQARKQRWWFHGTYMVAAAAFQWSFQQ